MQDRMQKMVLAESRRISAPGQLQLPRRFPPPNVCGGFNWGNDKRDGPRRTLLTGTGQYIREQAPTMFCTSPPALIKGG